MAIPRVAALAAALAALAFLTGPVTSQHVCVYCRGGNEPPDPDARRIACTVNATAPLNCDAEGPLPACDDASVFSPVGEPYGCDAIERTAGGRPRPVTYDCIDTVDFQGREFGLRAIITDPSCPDQGTIWTECSYSTPLCQPRVGVEPVGGAVGQYRAVGEAGASAGGAGAAPGAETGAAGGGAAPGAETGAAGAARPIGAVPATEGTGT
jgi:hypothetical protein